MAKNPIKKVQSRARIPNKIELLDFSLINTIPRHIKRKTKIVKGRTIDAEIK